MHFDEETSDHQKFKDDVAAKARDAAVKFVPPPYLKDWQMKHVDVAVFLREIFSLRSINSHGRGFVDSVELTKPEHDHFWSAELGLALFKHGAINSPRDWKAHARGFVDSLLIVPRQLHRAWIEILPDLIRAGYFGKAGNWVENARGFVGAHGEVYAHNQSWPKDWLDNLPRLSKKVSPLQKKRPGAALLQTATDFIHERAF